MSDTTRRGFLRGTLGVVGLAAFGGWAVGCGDSGGGGDNNPEDSGSGDSCAEGAEGNIQANHGHELEVSAEDIAAAQEKTYDIQGQGDHLHKVTLTADHFATLRTESWLNARSYCECSRCESPGRITSAWRVVSLM